MSRHLRLLTPCIASGRATAPRPWPRNTLSPLVVLESGTPLSIANMWVFYLVQFPSPCGISYLDLMMTFVAQIRPPRDKCGGYDAAVRGETANARVGHVLLDKLNYCGISTLPGTSSRNDVRTSQRCQAASIVMPGTGPGYVKQQTNGCLT